MVEPSEPSPWDADVVLADGGTVHVRPIRPDDADAFGALHGSLSPRVRLLPVLLSQAPAAATPRSSGSRPSTWSIASRSSRCSATTWWPSPATTAGRERTRRRWRSPSPTSTTAGACATLLLEHLAAIARADGIDRFTAEVLPDNRPMLGGVRPSRLRPSARGSRRASSTSRFDLVPTPDYLDTVDHREQRAESRSIARLLRPRSIAVIGASDEPSSVGRALIRNLLDSGFAGPVYPVNPTHPARGQHAPLSPPCLDVPDDVAARRRRRARRPDRAVRDGAPCAAKRVRGAGDRHRGSPTPARAGAMAAPAGRRPRPRPRHAHHRVRPAWACITTDRGRPPARQLRPGPRAPGPASAMSLQSGPLGTACSSWPTRLGVGSRRFVSLGNKADVSGNDLLNYWEDDPDTEVVLALHRELRQPPQVRADRPAGVAPQADRGREVRPAARPTTSPPTPCTSRPA